MDMVEPDQHKRRPFPIYPAQECDENCLECVLTEACFDKMYLDESAESGQVRKGDGMVFERCGDCECCAKSANAKLVAMDEAEDKLKNEEPYDDHRVNKQPGWLNRRSGKKHGQIEVMSCDWFTEEPDIQEVLKEQRVLHMAYDTWKVTSSDASCKEKLISELGKYADYYHLLSVVINEGVIRFPDGKTYVVSKAE